MARFGASTGHIALVLDCSGSMGPPVGQAYGPTTKYNEALAALRQVLQGVPKGATVSLWAFGQATGPGTPDAGWPGQGCVGAPGTGSPGGGG